MRLWPFKRREYETHKVFVVDFDGQVTFTTMRKYRDGTLMVKRFSNWYLATEGGGIKGSSFVKRWSFVNVESD